MTKSASEFPIVALQSVCHQITDGKHGDCQNEENSGYYFLSAKDVRDNKLVYEGARQITKEDFLDTHRRTKLEPLDILIVSTGATIGRMAVAQDNELTSKTTFQKSVAIVKPDQRLVDARWLFYKLNQAKDQLVNLSGGTAQGNLLLRDLRALQIQLPPIPTQRKIADVLSAYDDLIEVNTRRIRILEEMAQSVYREWFGKVNAQSLPDGWEKKPFSELVDIDPATPVDKQAEKPFVGMNALSTNSMLIDLDLVEMRTGNSGAKFQNRDVLFPRITPSVENGKAGFVQFLKDRQVSIGSTEIIVFREKELIAEFIYFLSREHEFRGNAINSMIGASGRQRVQLGCFDTFDVAKPPMELQKKFVEAVAPMFKLTHTLASKNANLRRTRDLLLPRLVSGEVIV